MSRGTLAEVLSLTPKRALSDDVVVRLRDAISSGQLAPGERLSEELLAEMVGISRGPIREATGYTPVEQYMAAGLIFSILPVLFYLVMQRYIIASLTAGAVKG